MKYGPLEKTQRMKNLDIIFTLEYMLNILMNANATV